MHWPTRTPDLTHLDFYFWPTLKARVYHSYIPTRLNDLKQKITRKIEAFKTEEFRHAVHKIVRRFQLIIQENGDLIEQLFLFLRIPINKDNC